VVKFIVERSETINGNFQLIGEIKAGAVLQQQYLGTLPLGMPAAESLMKNAVPSLLFAGQLDRDLISRNEEALLADHYGIDPEVDYLPTISGSLLAIGGVWLLIGGSFILGTLSGFIDRCFGLRSPVGRCVWGMTILSILMCYEDTLEGWLLRCRGIATVALLLQLIVLLDRPSALSAKCDRSSTCT
jgi:hypothetical protein